MRAWPKLRGTVAHLWFNGRAVAGATWHLRGARTGTRVRLRGRPRVRNAGEIRIGSRVQLVSTLAPLELVTGPRGTITIGDRGLVNYGTCIAAAKQVEIGPRCLIGTHVLILDHEPADPTDERQCAPIRIGENVWLGARVTVRPGVTIGDDSCIAAGSVVDADVPARSLAAGVPARVIRSL